MWLRRLIGVVVLLAGMSWPAAAQAPAAKQSVSEKIAADATKLDLNTATPDQLKALPGMGEAYVKRVIEGRPYTAKNQLTTRGILPAEEYERIKEQVIAHRLKKQT
jgi:DNA uptake protein ComE-like DNA-binding protein